MRILVLTLTVSILSSCLIGEEGHDSAAKVSTEVEEESGSKGSFDQCLKILKFEGDVRAKDRKTDDIIPGIDILAKGYSFNEVKLYIGYYGKDRNFIMRKTKIMPADDDTGSYKAALAALNKHNISCHKDGAGHLTLSFPENRDDDYDVIDLTKSENQELFVYLGTFSQSDERIFITTETRETEPRAKDYDSYYVRRYHAFDTDDEGRIYKHVYVDKDGNETVKLNHQFQKLDN